MLNLDRPQYSFATQIKSAYEEGASAFLLTANSAIPVADSIRGFYDELGVKPPHIDYITVPPGPHHINPQRLFGSIRLRNYTEKLRLRSSLRDCSDQVYVIDEYVESGKTLERAINLLESTGVTASEIRGRWYTQARRSEVDLDRMTSVHKAQMYEIGQKACAMSFSSSAAA